VLLTSLLCCSCYSSTATAFNLDVDPSERQLQETGSNNTLAGGLSEHAITAIVFGSIVAVGLLIGAWNSWKSRGASRRPGWENRERRRPQAFPLDARE
jgi:hypothetical protein